MEVETVRMSSKGQVVIPQGVREELHASEGTIFAVTSSGDTVVLKRITMPSKENLIAELGLIAKKAKKHLQMRGFSEIRLKTK